MTEPLSVNTDGVRSLSDIHSTVAAGLGSVSAAAPGAAAVTTSHGTIASAVDTALKAALGSRSSTMTTTQASGARISELLHQAALAYERGDQRGAEAIRSAADAIARGETPAGPAGSAGSAGSAAAVGAAGASPAAGGSDTIGQLAGQLSQLGQTGQQLGAPLSALGQPLQQLPQQVMQGVQQIAQTTAQATGSEAAVAQPAEGSTMAEERQRPDGDTAPDDDAGAAPGATSGAGQAPIDLPQAAPVTPTQPATD
ncbi:ESX-1 secretion-associated protein [Mycobacterium sp. Y57]|uniref:ESX-1 secretion-associated protein n=1 Tax=Mycolicibacterium xanthum TaxID=2796469 RepID=UPI001C866852|nr:ESX-1 secretion-associated protein [Mycolicibacterium xanthum]MBX7432502.1 ESX-1 secretion-associated protein [Mycolicibacterium xanthum]